MSKKELTRRELCSRVMKQAWKFKKGGGWFYSFANCLRLTWSSIKGVIEGFRHSRVVGVSFKNSTQEGGADRQKVIAALLKYPKWMISIHFRSVIIKTPFTKIITTYQSWNSKYYLIISCIIKIHIIPISYYEIYSSINNFIS